MKGILLAHEFENVDSNFYLQRTKQEQEALTQLRNNYNLLLKDTEQQLSETKTSISDWFENTEQEYSKLHQKQITDFKNQHEKNQTKVTDLENLYTNKLMFSKPAEYWQQRAKTLKKDANKWTIWLAVAILFAITLLLVIIFNISHYSTLLKSKQWY